MSNTKIANRLKRKKRVRGKIFRRVDLPRLSVFRSGKHIYAQIINDAKGITLVNASDLVKDESLDKNESSKSIRAGLVGELLAKKALKKKITKVVFDRNGYMYHGRIKSLAEGARKGGLKF